jgi:hypothetical protein
MLGFGVKGKAGSHDDEQHESGYALHYMESIEGRWIFTQVIGVMFLGFTFAACSPSPDRIVEPPETPPLSGRTVGYAVISVSYARILNKPENGAVSFGVVSGGTVLKVLERRLVRKNPAGETSRNPGEAGMEAEYWLLTEGSRAGWIPGRQAVIYDTEEKARTASSSGY